jgi:hypothetical protein
MSDVAPKAFISYAWSSPAHEQWVLDLATRLVEDGVDIKLDKWELGIGQDKYAFMESMVTDSSVTKVIVICDKTYTDKANKREGGVGTEAQILTPELYKAADQSKFGAVIREDDPEGEAYVPTFFKSRIYIAFTDEARSERSYEELLRWLLGKPQHVKPKLGRAPEYITNAKAAAIGTTSTHKRAVDAIRDGRPNAGGLVQEYADVLLAELEGHRIIELRRDVWDDDIVAAAENMRPYIRQLSELIVVVARFSSPAFYEALEIYERIVALTLRPANAMQWSPASSDAYKMISYEAFLQFIAVLLFEKKFDFVGAAIDRGYYVPDPDRYNRPAIEDFGIFSNHVGAMEHRKRRLSLNWIDLQATIMHEAQDGHWPNFEQMMQADYLLFITSAVRPGMMGNWYPRTLVYRERSYSPFELFARSESASFYGSWAPKILGPIEIPKLKEQMEELDQRASNWFGYNGLAVSAFGNAKHLGIKL